MAATGFVTTLAQRHYPKKRFWRQMILEALEPSLFDHIWFGVREIHTFCPKQWNDTNAENFEL
tara:strand:- start:222 stop:410 length:189 start_codon:yes stop_codon:yes gene_type:complete